MRLLARNSRVIDRLELIFPRFFEEMGLHPILYGLASTLFTYALTAAGSACVFIFDTHGNQRKTEIAMAVATGLMLAAVVELLADATTATESTPLPKWAKWLPTVVGVVIACGSLWAFDVCLQRLTPAEDATAIPSSEAITPKQRFRDIPDAAIVFTGSVDTELEASLEGGESKKAESEAQPTAAPVTEGDAISRRVSLASIDSQLNLIVSVGVCTSCEGALR